MVAMIDSRIRELEELITNGQFSEVETVWLEAAPECVADPHPFIQLAQGMVKEAKDQAPLSSQLMEVLIDPLLDANKLEDACVVADIAAELDPNNRGLLESGKRAYSKRFDGVDGFDAVLMAAEEEFGNQPGAFVKRLHELCSYRPGDYLFHDAGWGLGKVVELDFDQKLIYVDFEESPRHEVKLEAATKFFRKLPADHILARKANDLADVKKQALDDAPALLKCVMKSLEGKVNLRRVKTILSPDVINKTNWAKWWADAKKELANLGTIRVGTGNNPNLELLHIPTTLEGEYADRLASCHTSEDFALTLLRYVKESKETDSRGKFLGKQLQLLFDRLNRKERVPDGEKILAKFLLDDMQAIEDIDIPFALDVKAICEDSERVLATLQDIAIPDYQNRALDMIKDINPEWQEVYEASLLKVIPDCWDRITEDLRESGADARVHRAAKKIFETFDKNPEQMMWLSRHIIADGDPEDFGLNISRQMAMTELLRLGVHIFHNLERGNRRSRARLLKFRALLSERNNRLMDKVVDESSADQCKHILHDLRLNGAFSDAHHDNLEGLILGKYPELAQKEVVETLEDEDTGELLTTITGFRRKRAELDDLLNVQMPTIQKAIGEALALGDISENAELDAARAKEEVLRSQVGSISGEIDRARVVKRSEVDPATAGFGSVVTLNNTETGADITYTILGRWDADSDKGIISDISAIARGILNARVGESRTFKTPDGQMVTYKVVNLEAAEFEDEEE